MLADSIKARVDSKKPRQEGLTYTIDKLEALDRENFEIISPLIDLVKIYGAFPLLIPDSILKKKIQFYHDHNILVSTGSSITEYAYAKSHFSKFVEEASKIGFDVIEIGENSIDLNLEQKEKIVSTIRSYGLQYHWKVGKKEPRHQLGMDKILEKIEEATKIDKTIGSSSNNLNGNMFTSTRSSTENSTTDQKIVVEANEGVNVGIYDEKGSIKWGTVGALTSKLPPSKFIFETPLESQQSALIAEFGQRVNLAEIRPNLVAPIELQRLGIVSKATYGISYLRKTPEGVPASKSR